MSSVVYSLFVLFFFFTDTATTEIYTLSLHDALPILMGSGIKLVDRGAHELKGVPGEWRVFAVQADRDETIDRKSTRLNSSHRCISYAVFCLKKKKNKKITHK